MAPDSAQNLPEDVVTLQTVARVRPLTVAAKATDGF